MSTGSDVRAERRRQYVAMIAYDSAEHRLSATPVYLGSAAATEQTLDRVVPDARAGR